MTRPKKKPDGRTSQVLQRDSQETHQVPDNPQLNLIRDSSRNPPALPELSHGSQAQANASDTIGNGRSSEQVRAKFQIASEDHDDNLQTNHEKDSESNRKSSDLTPIEESDERQVTATLEEQNIPIINAPHIVFCMGNPWVFLAVPVPIPINYLYPRGGYGFARGSDFLYPYPWWVTRGYYQFFILKITLTLIQTHNLSDQT